MASKVPAPKYADQIPVFLWYCMSPDLSILYCEYMLTPYVATSIIPCAESAMTDVVPVKTAANNCAEM
eukprot:1962000-Pyramimonas_sp.AAC.1